MKQTAKQHRCLRGITTRITVLISLTALALTSASCINGDDIRIPSDTTVCTTIDDITPATTEGEKTDETSAALPQTDAETVHVHELVLSQTTEPTCTEIGVGTYICSCGETRVEVIADALGHDIEPATCTAGAVCRRCGTVLGSSLGGHTCGEWQTYIAAGCETCGEDRAACLRCGKTVRRETAPRGHTFDNGKCKKCGMADSAFGVLDFQLNGDSSGYTVIGIGSIGTADITVPATHNGLPVMGIGDAAFKNNQNIRTVTLPGGIIEIGNHSFFGCSALESINFPNGLTSIGMGALANCSSLKSIALPDSLTGIGTHLFTGCVSLTSVEIGSGLTYIGESMFWECTSLGSVELPRQVTSVHYDAFSGCTALISVTLSENVTKLHNSALSGTRSLTEIHYGGTITEWETLTSEQYYVIDTEITVYCQDGQTVFKPTIPEMEE